MSHCVFIAADTPLPEVTPSQDYPLHIDLDTGTIFDGGADYNYFLLAFDEVDLYCEKEYGVYLELPQFNLKRSVCDKADAPFFCQKYVKRILFSQQKSRGANLGEGVYGQTILLITFDDDIRYQLLTKAASSTKFEGQAV